jgi:hypothetical protein
MTLTGARTSWTMVVVPALICAAHQEANFVLVRQACWLQRNTILYVVALVSLGLIALMGLVSYLTWRSLGSQWPGESADIATRTRFIAMLGMLGSGLFFLVTLAQGIATVYLNPCQL